MGTTSDIARIPNAGIEPTFARPNHVMGAAALGEIERRANLAVIDHYLSRPFNVRSVHREARRAIAPTADGAGFGGPPVYDATIVDELRQVLKPASIGRALELFEMQISRVVDVCFEATRNTLALEAHGLSGSAGMLGFMELGEASRTLQNALGAEAGDRGRADEAIGAFAGALRRASRVIVDLRAAERADAAN